MEVLRKAVIELLKTAPGHIKGHWSELDEVVKALAQSEQEPVFDITAAVDAAMVEMRNMYPPMRRSECERLIKAALFTAPPSKQEQESGDKQS